MCFMVTASVALAQTPPRRDGKLLVTVMDPTGGVLPGATVTIVGEEAATKAVAVAPAKTSDRGLATIEALALGRYTIQGEFPGFETGVLKDVRVRTGDNKQTLTLRLKKMEDSVTVSRDPREAASDRAGLFGSALTREQIAALSEDPEEMRRQLLEIAGPDAVMMIDSFEGAQLPPKAQIRSIRVSRDQFAAESHFAGGVHIEIITQPGIGPLRGGVNTNYSGSKLESRNPFAPTKGPAANNGFGLNIGGSLIKNRSSFSLSVSGSKSYTSPILRAALPGGTRSETLNLRQPNDSVFGYGQWDLALTKDQTLRTWFSLDRYAVKNAGVGGYDLPERAYWTEDRYWTVRVQESGPIGRRGYLNSRVSIGRTDSDYHSQTEAPTIRVLDAFTNGGAQRTGGRRSWGIGVGSDIDYVRGAHSLRAGIQLDGLVYRSNEALDYLGTYTFASLADYEAGRPRSYTRRTGNPRVKYNNLYAGVYLQDDIRLSKSFTVSPGIRYETQTHLSDYNNVAPRFGFTWSPFKSGKTTLRASAGIFYEWVSTGTYEQTLRIDGFRQQELNVLNPNFPDPGLTGVIPATNRYLYSDNVRMVRTNRLSVGVQQTMTTRFSLGASYSDSRGANVARGDNLNAPVSGIRPDPAYANVIQVISDAENRSRSLTTNFSVRLATPSPTLNQAFFNWRRVNVSGSYTLSKAENNSDGTFAVLASNDLATEWGPSFGDVRHRVQMSIGLAMIKNLGVNLNVRANSAGPYNIRTGADDNGDLVFNDRPVGVGRNSARGSGAWNLDGNFSYGFGFGKRRVTLPPGVMITSAGGVTVNPNAAQEAPRYRVGLNVRISNLTNHRNLGGYSGVMTSPFFGKAQSVTGVRKVYLSTNLSF